MLIGVSRDELEEARFMRLDGGPAGDMPGVWPMSYGMLSGA